MAAAASSSGNLKAFSFPFGRRRRRLLFEVQSTIFDQSVNIKSIYFSACLWRGSNAGGGCGAAFLCAPRHSQSGAEHCECFLLAAVNIRLINPRGEESFEVANIFYIKNRKHSTSKLINLLAGCVCARCSRAQKTKAERARTRERKRLTDKSISGATGK